MVQKSKKRKKEKNMLAKAVMSMPSAAGCNRNSVCWGRMEAATWISLVQKGSCFLTGSERKILNDSKVAVPMQTHSPFYFLVPGHVCK